MAVKIPGPPVHPAGIYGNILEFYNDQLSYMKRCLEKYGPVCTVSAGNPGIIFLFGAENNKEILNNDSIFTLKSDTPANTENALARLTSGNIFNLTGEMHREQRKLLLHGLNKNFFTIFHNYTRDITETFIRKLDPGAVTDLIKIFKDLVFAIDSKVLLGLNTENQTDIFMAGLLRSFIDSYEELSEPLLRDNIKGNRYSRVLNLAEQLELKLDTLVRQKKRNKTEDVLSFLIHPSVPKEKIKDKELICHIYALFTAGHDTTSSALFWTVLMLILHPEVMKKVLDELQQYENHGFQSLNGLKYLDKVIRESMRLFPPSAILARICNRDYQLGNYLIPKGANIFISQYITHHNPVYFEEPDSFLPERWDTVSPSPFEYFPFGAGAHFCIGASLAMMKLKTIIPILLRSFSFSLLPGTVINRQLKITLMTREPVLVKLSEFSGSLSPVPQIGGNINEMVKIR